MNLLPHQVRFAKGYSDKGLIVHEGGTGKTVCAAVWLRDNRDGFALVICSKRIIQKWRDTLKECQTKATILSKEEFKKIPICPWSAIVVDEADEFASPLFTKQRSQLSSKLYEQVKKYDCPILLLTATPIRSTPWNLHSLLCFMRIYIDKTLWQNKFFNLERRPFLSRPAWFPKSNWRIEIRSYLEKFADIVLLRDCVEYLPPVTENVRKTPCGKFVKPLEIEPIALFVAEHRHEQTNKIETILEISKTYRKVLIVAHYVEQIEKMSIELTRRGQTFTVHGSVKNQEEILKQANETDECFLIVQASLGVGFDADSFSCVIFASMSYKVRDYVQMKYRARRIHNLHPVEYNYLIGGKCDKAVYDTIMLGKDFIPSEYYESARITEN